MKRPFLKFCKGLRNALIVCGLMTAVHYKRVCKVTLAIAPFALVQKAKKLNPDMTAEEEAGFKLIEEAITEHYSGLIDMKALETKMATFKTELETKGGLPTKEKYDELFDTVKDQGQLIDQIKTANKSSQVVDNSFRGQIVRELTAKIDVLKSAKLPGALRNGENLLTFEIKAAGQMFESTTTASTTAATAIAFPTAMNIPGLTEIARNQPFLIDLIGSTPTSNENITWQDKYNVQGTASWVAEGVVAPQVSFDIKVGNSRAKDVTASTEISLNYLDDVNYIAKEVEKEVKYAIDIKVDNGLLTGTGINEEIAGITSFVGGYVTTTIKTDTPNNSDAIMAASTQIKSLNFRANVACLNPIDFANTKMLKGTTGYYLINPNDGTDVLGGLRVVENNQIPIGKVLVMDTNRINCLTLQDLTITIGMINDNFTKRLVNILGVKRIHNFIKTPDINAFVYDDLATIKAAIANPSV